MILNKDYKHLVQKPLLCFPTCVAMVALRRGVWIDQEQLAFLLGIKVTAEFKDAYALQFPTTAVILESGYDVRSIDEAHVNQVLEDLEVPVLAQFFPISQIAAPHAFVIEHIEAGHDIMPLYAWCGFKSELTFFAGQERFAHFVLVSSFDTETETMQVSDPYGNNPSLWEETLDTFTEAMRPEWDGHERGFFIFSDISSDE